MPFSGTKVWIGLRFDRDVIVHSKLVAQFFNSQRVLVTGGAGFIGSHVVEMLLRLGACVTVPIRATTSLEFLEGVRHDITLVQADLFERSQVDTAMKHQDVVLHLAAAKGGGIAHSMLHHGSLFRDNLLSFITVLESARHRGVGRFLVVSSACVYPRDAKVPTPEDEGVRDVPEPTNAGYGWSKRMEEYMASAYRDEFNMTIRIARPFNAYGPRDDFFREYNHVIPGLITRVFQGEDPLRVWGTGQQTRSFLFVTDFARGLLEVCAQDHGPGPFNLGSSEEVSIRDLAQLIIDLSGVHTKLALDASKPDGQPRRTCDVARAKEAFGFEARVSLREGLGATLDWYKQAWERRNAKT